MMDQYLSDLAAMPETKQWLAAKKLDNTQEAMELQSCDAKTFFFLVSGTPYTLQKFEIFDSLVTRGATLREQDLIGILIQFGEDFTMLRYALVLSRIPNPGIPTLLGVLKDRRLVPSPEIAGYLMRKYQPSSPRADFFEAIVSLEPCIAQACLRWVKDLSMIRDLRLALKMLSLSTDERIWNLLFSGYNEKKIDFSVQNLADALRDIGRELGRGCTMFLLESSAKKLSKHDPIVVHDAFDDLLLEPDARKQAQRILRYAQLYHVKDPRKLGISKRMISKRLFDFFLRLERKNPPTSWTVDSHDLLDILRKPTCKARFEAFQWVCAFMENFQEEDLALVVLLFVDVPRQLKLALDMALRKLQHVSVGLIRDLLDETFLSWRSHVKDQLFGALQDVAFVAANPIIRELFWFGEDIKNGDKILLFYPKPSTYKCVTGETILDEASQLCRITDLTTLDFLECPISKEYARFPVVFDGQVFDWPHLQMCFTRSKNHPTRGYECKSLCFTYVPLWRYLVLSLEARGQELYFHERSHLSLSDCHHLGLLYSMHARLLDFNSPSFRWHWTTNCMQEDVSWDIQDPLSSIVHMKSIVSDLKLKTNKPIKLSNLLTCPITGKSVNSIAHLGGFAGWRNSRSGWLVHSSCLEALLAETKTSRKDWKRVLYVEETETENGTHDSWLHAWFTGAGLFFQDPTGWLSADDRRKLTKIWDVKAIDEDTSMALGLFRGDEHERVMIFTPSPLADSNYFEKFFRRQQDTKMRSVRPSSVVCAQCGLLCYCSKECAVESHMVCKHEIQRDSETCVSKRCNAFGKWMWASLAGLEGECYTTKQRDISIGSGFSRALGFPNSQ